MKSNYKPIGDYVKQVKLKNTDNSLTVEHLRGIRINKEFMPSVANVTGTDLSKYRVVKRYQFAYNPMHVGRDEILPISMLADEEAIIVSPAYVIFEIIDTNELLPEYLMIWCRRSEFDRNAWFTTDSSVRGGFSWDDFCGLELPVPSIDKQKEIVKEYHTITNRIKLNEQLNKKLEDTAQAIYKEWFVDFEFPNEDGKPYKSSGGEMEYSDELDMDIPENWKEEQLRTLIDIQNGYAFKSHELQEKGLYPIIKIKNINSPNIDLTDSQYYPDLINEQLEKYIIKDGDILISMTGSSMNQMNSAVGQVGRYTDKFKSLLNQRVGKLIPRKELNCRFYIYFFIIMPNTHLTLLMGATGSANQANISPDQIKSLKILVPSKQVLNQFEIKIKTIMNFSDIKFLETKELYNLKDILLSKMSIIS